MAESRISPVLVLCYLNREKFGSLCLLIFQFAFLFLNKHLYRCKICFSLSMWLFICMYILLSLLLRHARARNYVSESEACKLESVPLDFGDYHPLKPITVSFGK